MSLDLVTTYVSDFPKISIPNRASAAKFATNPTVACPLKYGVSKLTTAIFESIGLEHLSNVNVETLSRLQREDPTLSNCRLKALNNVDESKDVKFAFYYENHVLKRKWQSKDGYKRNNKTEVPSVYIFLVLSDLTLDDHVLTLAQPFLTALVKQSGSPFYNHLLTPIFSSKHCSHNKT
jgi:DNA-directed RNA polymerase subunit L